MKISVKKHLILTVTWLLRICVGGTFIFSGFVKGIDPWGTLYKFQDYVGSFGWALPINLLLTAVFLLCIYEFVTGIFIVTGCFRRSAPIAAAALMVIMLPLTLWIAISDPVADCGCFGDALIISNWATFWKNVVLCAAIAWLIIYNSQCRSLIRPYIQWVALIFSAAYILIIGLVGYFYQPLIDFRAFPIGSVLAEDTVSSDGELGEGDAIEEDDDEDNADEMVFVYSKNGIEKKFTINDDLPDEADGWSFVRREEGDPERNHNNTHSEATLSSVEEKEGLHVWSEDGNEEITPDVLRTRGDQLLLLMPDMGDVSIASTWQINSLQKMAEEQNVDMIAIVSGSNDEIARWKDLSLAAYPIYKAEDTQIKMLVRGNPALVYLHDGKIVWKSTLRSIDTEMLENEELSGTSLAALGRENIEILRDVTGLYLALMLVLIFFSILPSLSRFFPSKMQSRIQRRDTALKAAEHRQLKKAEERLHIPAKIASSNRDDKGDHEGSTHPDKSAQ